MTVHTEETPWLGNRASVKGRSVMRQLGWRPQVMERMFPQWEATRQVTHPSASGIRKGIYHHALHQEEERKWLLSSGSFWARLGARHILFLVMEKAQTLSKVAAVKTQKDHCMVCGANCPVQLTYLWCCGSSLVPYAC